MCSGNDQHHAQEEARRQQAAADAQAAAAQAEMDRIAREQEAVVAQQQAQLQQLQSDQAAAVVAQKEQASTLQAQQAQRVGEISARGQAVSSSLRILASASTTGKQGPTAALTPGGKGRASASRANETGLRIGSTMTGNGVGTNLGT
jgi:hypothetical protein